MSDHCAKLPKAIEVYEIGARRLYAKTSDKIFAIFEDDLSPEELMAIARDIAARRGDTEGQPFAGQTLHGI
jgi:hypothetical protein